MMIVGAQAVQDECVNGPRRDATAVIHLGVGQSAVISSADCRKLRFLIRF